MDPAFIAIFLFVIVSSLTFHEAAHAWVATACGDTLAKSQGRVTLNPLSHIDLFGTIILPIVLISLAGIGFGYAKPVPFLAENFRHPRRDTVLVALAGPAANLVLAVVFFLMGLVLIRLLGGPSQIAPTVLVFFWAAVLGNLVLMIFNLLPIPPLDGHYVLDLFLSERARNIVRQFGIFGIIIAWLLADPIFDVVIPPIHNFLLRAYGVV